MLNTTSPGRKRRWRIAGFLALSLIVSLTASSCGGAAEERGPSLPAPLASDLAARSDRVADLLAAGEVCAAAQAADELQAAVVDAVNARRVPAELQEELTAAANDLVNEVNCPPPPPPAQEAPGGEGGDRGEGRGKGKEQDKKDKGRDKKDKDEEKEKD